MVAMFYINFLILIFFVLKMVVRCSTTIQATSLEPAAALENVPSIRSVLMISRPSWDPTI
ncbi:hypothetical protein DCAR_0312892 [Daucus carota subsp. sativus]|uniref:Uncharacterized protein n=1 Tax=Daucus carota subsp. sativus TaxID=79200 RepID=A0A166BCB9_DAUCS|nr:hypothetical protein DCAR_0312892 [Daucus carota subsp. sativus]